MWQKVGFYGVFADIELAGNLLVGGPF